MVGMKSRVLDMASIVSSTNVVRAEGRSFAGTRYGGFALHMTRIPLTRPRGDFLHRCSQRCPRSPGRLRGFSTYLETQARFERETISSRLVRVEAHIGVRFETPRSRAKPTLGYRDSRRLGDQGQRRHRHGDHLPMWRPT